ncbi:hypothetical protein ACLI4Q_06430 [Natrialbaceae archaeon A-CW1-1]
MTDGHILTRKRLFKISLIVTLLFLSSFVLIHHSIYPLRLTLTEGYLIQIPTVYWLILSLALITIFTAVYFRSSPGFSLSGTIMFVTISSSYQFLFRGLYGGDYTITSYKMLREDAVISPDTHFRYFEFSQLWILHRVRYLVWENAFSTVGAIEFGFFTYVVLFTIAIWGFAYFNLRDGFYAFVASALFFIIVRPFLNFQHVPQFFAMILLLFLLSIHHRSGIHWLATKLILFVGLVLTHPMFFVFYLGAIIIYPILNGIFRAFCHNTNSSQSVITAVLYGLKEPISTFKFVRIYVLKSLSSQAWLTYTGLALTIYLAFLLFRFVAWQRSLVDSLFFADNRGHTALFLQRFGIEIGYDLEEEHALAEASTQPLNHLSSLEISTYTTLGAMAVVTGVGLLFCVTSLIKPINNYRPFNLGISIISLFYLVAGAALNILGTRALQVLFIPFMLSISMIERKKVFGLFVIVLIIAASPILVANSLNNAAISGGATTGDYYTEEAGQFLQEYDYETVIQAKTTQYPIDISGEKEHIWVRNLLEVSGQEPYQPEAGDIIQFDYRLYHDLDRHFHQCNFESTHVIYDNTNQLMLVGDDQFACSSYE